MPGRVNPDWVAVLRQRAPGGRMARAREVDLDLTTYETRANALIAEWTRQASIRIRIREDKLLLFLRDGVYKTFAETGESGGGMTRIEPRLRAEELVLGLSADAPPADRPVSAYLTGSDERGSITNYGDIVLDVDDNVRPRTWCLLGDLVDTPALSGGQVLAPVPLNQPSIDAASYKRNVVRSASLAAACEPHRYDEALIFDGLRTSDLVSITYPSGATPHVEVAQFAIEAPWQLIVR